MLARTVREAAARFGTARVLVEVDGPTLTFAALDADSDALAAALRARGVHEGDRIVVTVPSGCAYAVAYAAAAKVGAALTGINSGLAANEQAALLEVADPAVVFDSVDGIRDAVEEGRRLPPIPVVVENDERIAALVFTSGTTGRPKAAVFRERQLRAVARLDTGGEWADQPGTPALSATHFAHVGFMTKFPWYLQRGLTTHVMQTWRAGPLLELASRLRVQQLGAIAAQVALLLREPDLDRFDLGALQTLVVGGAASSPSLVEEARARLAPQYLVRYSSTESGGCGLGTVIEDGPAAALQGVGRPRPGVEVAVRSDDGTVRRHGTGELCLRTPTSMSGYWRDDAATADVFRDGWLVTGDLAAVEEDLRVRIVGRTKEMYIRGGYNVAMGEVEAALALHPGIAACAIQPCPDPVMGEIGVAVIVPRGTGEPLDVAEVRRFLVSRLAKWKLPERVVLTHELPLTAMHKLDRGQLANIVALGSSRSTS